MIWLVAIALAGGWRQDGTGVVQATPPVQWTASWSQTTAPGGHASPVRVGELVVVTVEPHTLLALDARTGAERWRKAHPVVDALPPSLSTTIRAQLATATTLEAELDAARKKESTLLRNARRADATVSPEQLQAAATAVEQARARLDAIAPYRELGRDDIGFAAPTPSAQDDVIYALFGNGVLAAHNLDGSVRWQTWLGRTQPDKWGYTGGDAASLRLHDDTLVVPWGQLRGVDPATGATRWMGPAYPHYGTPTVTSVDGLAVVLTPAGEVLSLGDGALLASGLPRLFYLSPTAMGEQVWTIGGDGDANSSAPNRATRWTLSRTGAGIALHEEWSTALDTKDRFYASPIVHAGRLYAITRRLDLHVLDATTGVLVHRGVLEGAQGEAMSNLVLADERLFVSTDTGNVVEVEAAPPFAVRQLHTFERGLGTPWFEQGRVYQRSKDHVRCIGCIREADE